jgi:uncharacterized membrane protein/protein-disulfide isomerase
VFISGLAMAFFSALTIEHFFAANYPETIFEGSFCDISAFFNCDSSAYSPVATILGVPLGYFGLVVGTLFALGAVFPSPAFERTNRSLSLLTLVGVVALLVYAVGVTGTLCLLCTGFYVFSAIAFVAFWRYDDARGGRFGSRFLNPSIKHLIAMGIVTLAGAWGFAEYHATRRDALSGGAGARVVKQFYNLDRVAWPSLISPYWTTRSTERFEEAPVRVVAYADLLCPDCQYLASQLSRLEEEFEGALNVAFQFFPLDGACNDVVEKDLHPGACDVSYMAAHDPAKFRTIHDEIFANLSIAKASAEWREELGRRHGVGAAPMDSSTRAVVHSIIETGREYAKTSESYSYGIRSTPTMIINNRMIIGTLPYEQLRAIFRALVDEAEGRETGFLENWEETE